MFQATRTLKTALIAATLATVSGLALADTKDFSISVSAEIPTAQFSVTAAQGWNASEIQNFSYSNGALQKMSRTLEMKNTSGPIKAYLMRTAEMTNSGNDKIGIDVTLDTKAVPVGSSNSLTVLTPAQAAVGQRVSLELTPKLTGTPVPGVYNGQVALVFDSSI